MDVNVTGVWHMFQMDLNVTRMSHVHVTHVSHSCHIHMHSRFVDVTGVWYMNVTHVSIQCEYSAYAICLTRVTRVNVSYVTHIYAWHKWMRICHMSDTQEWLLPYTQHAWVCSISECGLEIITHTSLGHVTFIYGSCHICLQVMSHLSTSHVTHRVRPLAAQLAVWSHKANKAVPCVRDIYLWVMSYLFMCQRVMPRTSIWHDA